MMGRLKWEETDWCYLLAMLHKVLDQHSAQCLYPFILSSLPSLDSISLPATSLHIPVVFFSILVFFKHPSHCCVLSLQLNLPFPFPVIRHNSLHHIFSINHTFLFYIFLPFAVCLPLCLSVCLSAICGGWCERLASDETGVSLRVRNLTAQIT